MRRHWKRRIIGKIQEPNGQQLYKLKLVAHLKRQEFVTLATKWATSRPLAGKDLLTNTGKPETGLEGMGDGNGEELHPKGEDQIEDNRTVHTRTPWNYLTKPLIPQVP